LADAEEWRNKEVVNMLLQDLRIYPKKIKLYDRKFIYVGIQKHFTGTEYFILPTYTTLKDSKISICAMLTGYKNKDSLLGARSRYGLVKTSMIKLYINDEKLFWTLVKNEHIEIL